MKNRKYWLIGIQLGILIHGLISGSQWWMAPMSTAILVLIIVLPAAVKEGRQGQREDKAPWRQNENIQTIR
jgi:hypothetical protein